MRLPSRGSREMRLLHVEKYEHPILPLHAHETRVEKSLRGLFTKDGDALTGRIE